MTNTILPNLGPCANWSALICANLVKQGEPFFSGTLNQHKDGRALIMDPDGYPMSLASDQYYRTVFNAAPAGGPAPRWGTGQYEITWQGIGTVTATGGAHVVTIATEANRLVVNITDDTRNWILNVTKIGAAPNHVHNLRCVKTGTVGELNPEMVSALTALPYGGVRGMQPQLIDDNGGLISDWATRRPKMTDAQWSRNGVPFDFLYALANRMNRGELWENIPHLATDAYVQSFAQDLADHLKVSPNLRVILEWSNETWNGGEGPNGESYGYPQAAYCIQQGRARGYHYVNYPAQSGPTDLNRGALRFYGARSCEVFDIVRTVLRANNIAVNRVTFCVATQAANAWNSARILEFRPQGQTLAVGQRVNMLAVAPYPTITFNGAEAQKEARVDAVLAQSLDATFAELNASMTALFSVSRTAPTPIFSHSANAAIYGLRFAAYEGSASLVTPQLATVPSATVTPAQAAANVARLTNLVDLYRRMNLDPRIGTFTTNLLANWARFSTDTFAYFTICGQEGGGQVGSFGARRYWSEPLSQSPKRQALEAWVAAHPAP